MNCSDVRSLIGGYVLHALEPHEEETVRRHLAECPDCAREHSELAPLPALLDVPLDPEAEPAEPPASLEEAVLDRFAQERAPKRDWFSRPLPAAALAALAAAALTFGVTRALDGDGGGAAHKSYGAHLRAVAGGAPGQGSDPAPADSPHAYAKLYTSDSGTRVRLKASGLGGPPGAVYELWCVYPDGSKVSAGTFRADEGGRAEASMTTAARVGDYHHLAVEQRLPGRDARRVLAGDIAY